MVVVERHTAEELLDLYRRERDARVVKRLWIVRQARLGKTAPEIAGETGLARRSVQEWVARYNAEGVDGLRDRPGRGRKPILSVEEKQRLVERVEQGPRANTNDVCALRGVDFQKFVEAEFGKSLSLSSIYNLLHDLGYEWLVPRSKHRKSDPAAAEAFKKRSPTSSRGSKPSTPTAASSPSSKTRHASDNKGP